MKDEEKLEEIKFSLKQKFMICIGLADPKKLRTRELLKRLATKQQQ